MTHQTPPLHGIIVALLVAIGAYLTMGRAYLVGLSVAIIVLALVFLIGDLIDEAAERAGRESNRINPGAMVYATCIVSLGWPFYVPLMIYHILRNLSSQDQQ